MSTEQHNHQKPQVLPSNVTPFPYPYYPPATEDDTIDLVELILTIWRYWWLVLASVVLCLVAASVFLQITPKSYSSTIVYETYESSSTGLTQDQNMRGHHADPFFTDAAIVQ